MKNYLNNFFCQFVLFLFVFLLTNKVNGANNPKDTAVAVNMIGLSFGYQSPQLDMNKRFYSNLTTGLNFYRKTKKNLVFGVDWFYLFAQKVKEQDMFSSILNSDGFFTDENGQNASVRLYERGHCFNAKVGKLFPVSKKNKNSGILLLLNGGWLQHKIKIEDLGNLTPAIKKEYRNGYDRLSGGWNLGFFAGYLFMSNNRLFNFFGGFEGYYAQTKSLRSWDFNKMKYDDTQRKDMLIGVKVGILLPLYKRSQSGFYFY